MGETVPMSLSAMSEERLCVPCEPIRPNPRGPKGQVRQ
jgi:hypothetical protein